jgi:hypothetical protein
MLTALLAENAPKLADGRRQRLIGDGRATDLRQDRVALDHLPALCNRAQHVHVAPHAHGLVAHDWPSRGSTCHSPVKPSSSRASSAISLYDAARPTILPISENSGSILIPLGLQVVSALRSEHAQRAGRMPRPTEAT